MQSLKVYLFFLLQFKILFAQSQAINNTASFRGINSEEYFRFHYENDFFTGTDYYYTQGINLEYVHPSIKLFPLTKILFHSGRSNTKSGICIEHDGYTPTSIRHEDILYGDHPFAATLSLKTFVIAIDSAKQKRIS